MKTKEEIRINIRKQIMKSAIASFKLEGIKIPLNKAVDALKKVEINLGK